MTAGKRAGAVGLAPNSPYALARKEWLRRAFELDALQGCRQSINGQTTYDA